MDQQKYSQKLLFIFRRGGTSPLKFKLRKKNPPKSTPKLLLLINLQEKNRHLDVGLQERGSKRLGSGLHLGVAWQHHQQTWWIFGGKIFDPNATDNTSNIISLYKHIIFGV